ncbi:MAG: flagellar motor switch protein FliM [Proteobacteria bacterium]|nr:flagellar motor switch protein FliM [Pseudomonadota bacterium]
MADETDLSEEELSEDDKLAAEWAEAEMDGDDEDDAGDAEGSDDAGLSEDDQLAAEWAAMAGGDDEDAAAAEWAAMGEEGALEDDVLVGAAAVQPTRILNQDEIDSLLGFRDDEDDDSNRSGILAIVNSALVSYERLPMLEVVFDRLVRMQSTSLRNFTSDNVEVSLDNIQSLRFGDYLNSIPLPAMLGVFKAEEWDNYGLLTVDSSLIYSIVDVLLGGRRGTAPIRVEGRPYTTIERSLVERMVHVILNDLSAAFDPLAPVTFRFDRLETNPRFATIARPANAVILATLRVDMEDRGGKIELCLPYATLEPVRELLLQMFLGEKIGRDSIWETHLANQLWQTHVEIEAVLDEIKLPLDQAVKWKVGSQIMLNATPHSEVTLRCGESELFVGTMGRHDGKIAIKVHDRARRNRASRDGA